MNFSDIYKNATVLTSDWLKNECSYELYMLVPHERKTTYQNYYIDMCAVIHHLHCMRFSPQEVESRLEDPGSLATAVKSPAERKYQFLLATAKQLMYDVANGRTQMIRGEDGNFDLCRDARAILDMLGFCQRTYCMKW